MKTASTLAAMLTLVGVLQSGSGVIEGVVLQFGTAEPIAGATVTIQAPQAGARGAAGGGAAVALTTRTGGNGRFAFRDLPDGRYLVRVEADGYLTPPVNGTSNPALTTTAVIEPGSPRVDFNLVMARGGVISGRVEDALGRPVDGLQIQVLRLIYQNGHPTLTGVPGARGFQNVSTNSDGEYRVGPFGPGEYYLRADSGRAGRGTAGGGIGTRGSAATFYFPGTPNVDEAIPVVLSNGIELTAIDIHVPAGGVTISGKILNPLPGGVPRPNGLQRDVSSFFLIRTDTKIRDSSLTLLPNSGVDGNIMDDETAFNFRNVFPGAYELLPVWNDQSPGGRGYVTGSTKFEVKDADVDGIQSILRNNLDIGGRVVVSGTTSNIRLESLRLQLVPDIRVSLVRQGSNAVVDASGTFNFQVSEGPHRFVVSGFPARAYLSGLRYGNTDIYQTAQLDIGAGPSAPLEVTLKTDGATIRGRVTGSTRQPVLARVVLVPEPPRRGNALLFRRAVASPTGEFTLNGIAPGDYKLFAWETDALIPGADENPEFVSKYEKLGTKLTIAADATLDNVQTELIR